MADKQFDRLKMYFGEPYDVGNGMQILCPTVGDILSLDGSDAAFYQTLYIWVANPTTYRLFLWDNGIDWNKLSDFELFYMIYRTENPEVSKLLFGDIDFSNFKPFQKKTIVQDDEGHDIENCELVLYSPDNEIEIAENDYNIISSYLRLAFNIYPKVEKARGRATKEAIIDEERLEFTKRKEKHEDTTSSLLSLVSSCLNHPGFKYNLQELKQVNFVQFMDSVQRLQIYESSTALLKGSMSGFIDTSHINKDDLNWMRDIKK